VIDLLDAEQPIIDRLKAQVTGITGLTVASTASIVGSLPDALMHKLPALLVQPGAGTVAAYAGNGQAAAEDGEWIVVAVVKLIPDVVNLSKTYQAAAGALIGKTLEALAGWAPSPNYRPMKYVSRDEPEFWPGYVEFPLHFTTRRVFTGTGG